MVSSRQVRVIEEWEVCRSGGLIVADGILKEGINAAHAGVPVFPQGVRLVRSDRRTGWPDRAWRRRISTASFDTRYRLRCEVGGATQPHDQPRHPDFRDD